MNNSQGVHNCGELHVRTPSHFFPCFQADSTLCAFCRYSHKGDLAYVGSDKAVMQLPTFGLIQGAGAFFLWRGYETFRQISFRNKCLVAFDTLRSKIFGRDIEFGETDMPGDDSPA